MTTNDLNEKLSGPLFKHIFIVVVGILFALSIGVQYGKIDQTAYLPFSFKLIDPTFISLDWYTWQTINIHHAYNYLIYFLSFLGPLPIVTLLAYILFLVFFVESIYWITDLIYEKPLLPFITSIVLIQFISCRVILGTTFLGPELVPHNITGILFIIGITLLLHKQYLLSGVVLGLGVFMHGQLGALILLIIFPLLFYFYHIKHFSLRNILFVIIPLIALSIPNFIFIFKYYLFNSDSSFQNHALHMNFRAPGQYLPFGWGITPVIEFFSFLFIGIIGFAWRKPEKGPIPVIKAVTIIIGIITVTGYLGSTVVVINVIRQLLIFRIAPYLFVFCLIFCAGAIAQTISDYPNGLKGKWDAVYFIGVVLLLRKAVLIDDINKLYIFLLVLGISLSVLYIFKIKRKKEPKWIQPVYVIGLIIILLMNASTGFSNSKSGMLYKNKLFEWVRNSTPKNGVFIVPAHDLNISGFRMYAKRSIIVDWKCYPHVEKDSQEWYRRLLLVSGLEKAGHYGDIVTGYRNLDSNRLVKLVKEFNADYIIVEKGKHKGHLGDLEEVFRDENYLVYKIDFNDQALH